MQACEKGNTQNVASSRSSIHQDVLHRHRACWGLSEIRVARVRVHPAIWERFFFFYKKHFSSVVFCFLPFTKSLCCSLEPFEPLSVQSLPFQLLKAPTFPQCIATAFLLPGGTPCQTPALNLLLSCGRPQVPERWSLTQSPLSLLVKKSIQSLKVFFWFNTPSPLPSTPSSLPLSSSPSSPSSPAAPTLINDSNLQRSYQLVRLCSGSAIASKQNKNESSEIITKRF